MLERETRVVSFVEAEMSEMVGWQAPLDSDTVALLKANKDKQEKIRKRKSSRKPKKSGKK